MKKFGEIVQIVGAITSITGISLLWLRKPILDNFEDILFMAVLVALWLGAFSLIVLAIVELYQRRFRQQTILRRTVFFVVAVALAMLLFGLLMLVGNKIVIMIDWNWFFTSSP